MFVAGVLLTAALLRRLARLHELRAPAFVRALPPYAIGSLAAFWVLQRAAMF
jgi:hypothetical protein